jgi:predicted RNA-binding protein with PIN domain
VTAPELPAAAREVVARWAAAALRSLPAADVPPRLRPVAAFAPARLAGRAGLQLEQATADDPLFRQRVADRARSEYPAWAESLEAAGEPKARSAGESTAGSAEAPPPVPPGVPADVAAALLWVLRPAGWQAGVGEAADRLAAERRQRQLAQGERAEDDRRARLQAQVEQARDEAAQARGELAEAHRELARVRRELREARAAGGRSDAAARSAAAEAQAQATALRAELAEARAERDRQAAAAAAAEGAAEAARALLREGRALADARAKLLLDTVTDAALGLRRELGLPPASVRPGDVVAASAEAPGALTGPGPRARPTDDPARLDELLALPGAHLIVDGYNVTKAGYGELSLEQQRDRLLTGLAALAARTGAEVSCVFDGAESGGSAPRLVARGIRVLFSRAGEIADAVIRRLAAAEPGGRVVVVVSSDREVAEGVARSGARPVESAALLRLLGRG